MGFCVLLPYLAGDLACTGLKDGHARIEVEPRPPEPAYLPTARPRRHQQPHQCAPVRVLPCRVDDGGRLGRGGWRGVGSRCRRWFHLIDRAHRNPLPSHCASEGATEDRVNDADARRSKRAAAMRAAGAIAPLTLRGGVAGAELRALPPSAVLVAGMLAVGAVLYVAPAAAVITTAAELAVEPFDGLSLDSAGRKATKRRADVFLDLSYVPNTCLALDVDHVEPPVKEAVHRGFRAGVASLVDLIQEPSPDLLGFFLGLAAARPGGHGLAEPELLAAELVDPGVDLHPSRPAREPSDGAARASTTGA